MSDVLGLDRQMHEAYRVLLDQRECTTAEVADRLGISRPLAEQTLQRLAAAGLVTPARPSSTASAASNAASNGSRSTSTISTTTTSNPAASLSPSTTNGSTHDVVALTPVDPRRTLGPLLARKQAQIAAQQQELARAHEAVAAMASAYSTQARDEPDERPGKPDVSRGMSAVRSRVEELFASATSTVVCVLAEGTRGVALDVRAEAIQQTLDRGVAVKALMARGLVSDPVVLNQIRWLQAAGGLARTATLMPPPMMVVDGTIALVPADGQTATALVVRNRAMARALSSLFEHVWGHARAAATMPAASATPLADAQLVEREPSPAELDLLRLLGKGMTDASAARHLGVSLRTVRRMMAELMGRLDARSRFEAGIRAAEHGWVGAARQLANGSGMTAGKLPPGPGRRRLVAG
jgi:DNA-binding CsgD family transcriptional regulator/sugar-specific transcriptional regulator TrmB